MTLETAKKILEELPQDNSVRFKYRLKNYSQIREAEAICRGGFTFCNHTEDGKRVYVWLKVFPTEADTESSIDQALKLYNQKKAPSSKQMVKPVKTTQNVIEAKPTTTINLEHTVSANSDNTNVKEVHPLQQFIAYLKRKFDEFVKTMDEFVEE